MSSTPYDRQTSFALFSAENPSVPQSGVSLDAEFNAVKIAVDDTQQNLALIQDDDGALKRGSVGQAQFDSSVSIGFGPPTQWVSGALYTADVDTVFNGSKFYITNTTHTAGVSFDPTKFDVLADFTTSAVIPDGSISSAKLADGAVAAAKIADGSIATAKIASAAVTTTKLQDAAVTLTKLAAAIPVQLANLILPAGLGPLPWSMSTLPAGWDWADGGVLLSSTAYPTLRAALIADGYPHGQDGSGNPKKPDVRGRAVAGADLMNGAAAGILTAASGMNGIGFGAKGGTETVTLSTGQIPSHTHINTLTDPGHAHGTDAEKRNGAISDVTAGSVLGTGTAATVSSATTGISITNAAAGGGGSHSNVQPTMTFNMIIKAH